MLFGTVFSFYEKGTAKVHRYGIVMLLKKEEVAIMNILVNMNQSSALASYKIHFYRCKFFPILFL